MPSLEELNASILGAPAGAAGGAAPAAAAAPAEGAPAPDDVDELLKGLIDIDMGEGRGKRQLSKKQIASMMERYGDLSSMADEHSPVLDLVAEIRKASPNATPADIAQFLAAAASNFKPGGGKGEGNSGGDNAQPANGGLPTDDELTKWEKENAASLPPGYRELGTLIRQLTGTMGGQQEMLRRVLEASGQAAQAASDLTNSATTVQNTNARERIGMNLDKAQAQLGLDDDDAKPFMAFALDRGYVPEDFGRYDLTLKVMNDFKATKALPEFERLKKIAERRQAFAGSLGATPQSSAAKPAASTPGDQMLATLTDNLMAKRQ